LAPDDHPKEGLRVPDRFGEELLAVNLLVFVVQAKKILLITREY
jgi:hypothetical protein